MLHRLKLLAALPLIDAELDHGSGLALFDSSDKLSVVVEFRTVEVLLFEEALPGAGRLSSGLVELLQELVLARAPSYFAVIERHHCDKLLVLRDDYHFLESRVLKFVELQDFSSRLPC